MRNALAALAALGALLGALTLLLPGPSSLRGTAVLLASVVVFRIAGRFERGRS